MVASVVPEMGIVSAAVSVVKRQWRWWSASGDGFHRLAKNEFDLEVVRAKSGSNFPASCYSKNLQSF